MSTPCRLTSPSPATLRKMAPSRRTHVRNLVGGSSHCHLHVSQELATQVSCFRERPTCALQRACSAIIAKAWSTSLNGSYSVYTGNIFACRRLDGLVNPSIAILRFSPDGTLTLHAIRVTYHVNNF